MTMLFLPILLLALQDPAPLPNPEPVTLGEIEEQIGLVTRLFREADARLEEALEEWMSPGRTPVDAAPAPDPAAPTALTLLDEAASTSRQLVAEMEALLAMIPDGN